MSLSQPSFLFFYNLPPHPFHPSISCWLSHSLCWGPLQVSFLYLPPHFSFKLSWLVVHFQHVVLLLLIDFIFLFQPLPVLLCFSGVFLIFFLLLVLVMGCASYISSICLFHFLHYELCPLVALHYFICCWWCFFLQESGLQPAFSLFFLSIIYGISLSGHSPFCLLFIHFFFSLSFFLAPAVHTSPWDLFFLN